MAEHTAAAESRRGRRPGVSDTRPAILRAARARFARDGFAGATIRGIATDAGVDPALVMRFYGSKDELFAATLSIDPEAGRRLADAFAGPIDGLGARVVRTYLDVWADPELSPPLLAMLRSAVTHERAAEQLRDFLHARLTTVLEPRLGHHDASLHAAVAASQLAGLALARYVVRVEPLASADPQSVVELLAPCLQLVLGVDTPR